MTSGDPTTPPARQRSPGRTFFWVGGILVVAAVVVGGIGFVLPFLAFPFEQVRDGTALPDPEAVIDAAGGLFVGVGAVFLGIVCGFVGVVLVVVGAIRHGRRDQPPAPPGRTTSPQRSSWPPPPPPPGP